MLARCVMIIGPVPYYSAALSYLRWKACIPVGKIRQVITGGVAWLIQNGKIYMMARLVTSSPVIYGTCACDEVLVVKTQGMTLHMTHSATNDIHYVARHCRAGDYVVVHGKINLNRIIIRHGNMTVRQRRGYSIWFG